MPTYLEIAVNVPQVSGVFHYHLPPELEGKVVPGHLVEVPFGKQEVQGVVLRTVAQPSVTETRPVSNLIDPEVVVTPPQIQLATWMSQETLSPLAACIGLMLPPGLSQHADTLYQIPNPSDPQTLRQENATTVSLSPTQIRLLELLRRRGPLRGRQIDQALPRVTWRNAVESLVRRGFLSSHAVLPPPTARPKRVRTAQLASPPDQALASLDELGKARSEAFHRRQEILKYLAREPGPVEVTWVFAESGGSLPDLHYLAEHGLVLLGEGEAYRDPLSGVKFTAHEPPVLTHDQQVAWEKIYSGLQDSQRGQLVLPFLLQGVTGSGKTEIYLRAVEQALRQGRQAIVLVPEIAMTPQTTQRFLARFPGQVGLLHSQLSEGERYDTWRRARLGQLGLIVGPRSALFAPLPQIGLIVIDEFHEDSYYQESLLPHYNAVQASVAYARLCGAVCLFGSATPDITSRYQADRGSYTHLSLPARILAHRQAVEGQVKELEKGLKRGSLAPPPSPAGDGGEKQVFVSQYHPLDGQAETIDLPPVQVVDMCLELKAGNRSIFSRSLQASLEQAWQAGEQAILFLNRRGYATYVFCRSCGHTLKCPRCDIPLTLHHSKDQPEPLKANLICHRCGYQRKQPKTCPVCQSSQIRQYGTGTEKVENEVQALLPGIRTLRWDYETTRYKGAHEVILSHFSNRRADVLIGTQMIAKGLDLPFVTLVGVLLADSSLSLPDYRTSERSFQVLTQVAGRAGRSPLGGQVILQTFQPDHYVIQAAAHHDYTAFYQKELEHRRSLGYPPFSRFVRLEYRHAEPARAETAARNLAAQLESWISSGGYSATELIGPAPCYFSRQAGQYRWQIVLRGPDPAALLRGRSLGDWHIEVDPPSLL